MAVQEFNFTRKFPRFLALNVAFLEENFPTV